MRPHLDNKLAKSPKHSTTIDTLIAELGDDVDVVDGLEHFMEFHEVGVGTYQFQHIYLVVGHQVKNGIRYAFELNHLTFGGIFYLDGDVFVRVLIDSLVNFAELTHTNLIIWPVNIVLNFFLTVNDYSTNNGYDCLACTFGSKY